MHKLNFAILLLIVVSGTAMHCHRHHFLSRAEQEKVNFDYRAIDDHGLRHGETAVDYEFCIPANEKDWERIRDIAPGARLLKSSKGRIRCSPDEWLCIVNTHNDQWREQLHSIAALDMVRRIEEVFYE